jgi:hypothetical protein
VVAIVLGSGGSDKKPPATSVVTTTPATTTPGAASTTPAPGGDSKAESDIQLVLSTTLKAAREDDKLVFCGGLTVRYQNQTFGGPIECQAAAARGDLPKEFKSSNDAASSTQIEGTRATVITVDGTTFRFVKGTSFWQIDGVG